jgi:molybdenum cofactor cytidylyltransferase
LDEVIVMVGRQAEEIRHSVTPHRARFVEAHGFREGCTASIRAGLEALDAKAQAVVLILGDQPEIDSEIIATVVEGWRHLQAPAVRMSYHGHAGHPMLFAQALFGQLKALHGDKGVWKLLDAHPEWVREIAIDRPPPSNINTLEDYVQITAGSPA